LHELLSDFSVSNAFRGAIVTYCRKFVIKQCIPRF